MDKLHLSATILTSTTIINNNASMSTILPYKNILPRIDKTAFIANNATIIGDVEIGSGSSVWFGTVIRGDVNNVKIGKNTNIQDCSMIHVSTDGQGCYIGDNVTVGHMAMLHACTIEASAFVGLKACVMDDALVESGAMVAAGALVTPGKRVPTGQVWGGSPARYMREIRPEEAEYIALNTSRYVDLANTYLVTSPN